MSKRITLLHVLAFLVTLSASTLFSAQTDPAQNMPVLDRLNAAIALREQVTATLVTGSGNPDQAMARLRAHASPSGLSVDRDADFALAAIDVGQRLLAADRAALAEEFFLEAERSLVKAVKKTQDESAQEKALYLQQLAFIRANFLNKSDAADADLEAAIVLQPEDKHLKAMKTNHARGRAEQNKTKS